MKFRAKILVSGLLTLSSFYPVKSCVLAVEQAVSADGGNPGTDPTQTNPGATEAPAPVKAEAPAPAKDEPAAPVKAEVPAPVKAEAPEAEGTPPPGWVPTAPSPVPVLVSPPPASGAPVQAAVQASPVVNPASPAPPAQDVLQSGWSWRVKLGLNSALASIVIPTSVVQDSYWRFGAELRVGVGEFRNCRVLAGSACLVFTPIIHSSVYHEKYSGIISGSVQAGGEFKFLFATDSFDDSGKRLPPWVGVQTSASLGPGFATQSIDPAGLPDYLVLPNNYGWTARLEIAAVADLRFIIPVSSGGKKTPIDIAVGTAVERTPTGAPALQPLFLRVTWSPLLN